MAAREDQVDSVARAAMGCMHYVMGHSHASTWGVVKEAFALRSAVGDVPDGPARDLLRAAQARITTGSAPGPSIDSKEKERQVSEGRSLVEEALPVLASLTPDAADQVREWLLGVAEKVAAAAKDKGGSEKVTEAEAEAIRDLHTLLAG